MNRRAMSTAADACVTGLPPALAPRAPRPTASGRRRAPRERQLIVAMARRARRPRRLADRDRSRRCAPCARRRPSSTGSTCSCSRCSSPRSRASRCAARRRCRPTQAARRVARRDRAPRRQGQARAPGRPRDADLHRRAVREACAPGSARRAARARARPVEAQLLKGAGGYSGSISLTLAGAPRDPQQTQSPALGADRRVDRLERVDARRAGLGRGARRRAALGDRRRDLRRRSSACRCSRRRPGWRRRSRRRPTSA